MINFKIIKDYLLHNIKFNNTFTKIVNLKSLFSENNKDIIIELYDSNLEDEKTDIETAISEIEFGDNKKNAQKLLKDKAIKTLIYNQLSSVMASERSKIQAIYSKVVADYNTTKLDEEAKKKIITEIVNFDKYNEFIFKNSELTSISNNVNDLINEIKKLNNIQNLLQKQKQLKQIINNKQKEENKMQNNIEENNTEINAEAIDTQTLLETTATLVYNYKLLNQENNMLKTNMQNMATQVEKVNKDIKVVNKMIADLKKLTSQMPAQVKITTYDIKYNGLSNSDLNAQLNNELKTLVNKTTFNSNNKTLNKDNVLALLNLK